MRLSLALVLIAGCGEPEVEEPSCVPFEQAYTANVEPILTASCSECHGSTPEFGAPFSLVDGYEDLIAGEDGTRKVDKMLTALMVGDMPPSTAEALNHTDLDTLVGWASCGLQHPDPSEGLVVNRDVWEAGDTPPAGTSPLDLTAVNESVGLNAIDDYRTFSFSSMVTEDSFIRRIEPLIDESRVLHHITLTKSGGFPYLYAWAPGTGPIEFPNGGMRIRPGDTFEVEIHYNNGAGIEGAVDSSGVRLYVGEATGTEYGMMSPNTFDIYVGANSTGTATQTCTAAMDFDILAAFPHMHEVGSSFTHDIVRADGSVENLITLSGWSFESQYFYETPVHINTGDQMHMVCGFDNPNDFAVTGGMATSDEMCFDFLVVTPAQAATQCAF